MLSHIAVRKILFLIVYKNHSITESVSVHIVRITHNVNKSEQKHDEQNDGKINVSSTFFSIKAIDLIEDGCVAVAVAVCIGDPHRGY